jgi:hypothetical protein
MQATAGPGECKAFGRLLGVQRSSRYKWSWSGGLGCRVHYKERVRWWPGKGISDGFFAVRELASRD